MSDRKPTVGIVGLSYGRAHLAGFQAAGCEVVAVCQRNEAAARAVADKYGVPKAYSRWEDMIAKERLDIVAIASPPALHWPILRAAVAAGSHVVCEKPLAMDAAEARLMIDAVRSAGRQAITGFNWRFPAGMLRLKEMVDAGHLGRVFHINARWMNPSWVDAGTAPTWRMDRAIAGHGVMGDQGVHLIDMVRWVFGDFKRVCAQAGIGHPQRTVPGGARVADTEDHCQLIGELASGVQVSLTASRLTRGLAEHSMEVYGADGGAQSARRARWSELGARRTPGRNRQ